jgi:hypothetical protein
MNGFYTTGGPDIERLSARLTEELQTWFVELSCPTCHAGSGRIAVRNIAGQRAFDDRHRHCYLKPFSDLSL